MNHKSRFECFLAGCRFEIEQCLTPLTDRYRLAWTFTHYQNDGFVLMVSPSQVGTDAVDKAWNEAVRGSDIFAVASCYYSLLVWCDGQLSVCLDALPEDGDDD